MFFALIIGSVAVTYYRIMVKRDYIISAQQECDPAIEACFVSACDPESDSECAALPEGEQTTYYKIITKNAKNIPPCDPYKDECPQVLTCEQGEEECEFEYCDETNVLEGEECNDPAQYAEDNPPEEECACREEGGEPDVSQEDSLEASSEEADPDNTDSQNDDNFNVGSGPQPKPERY